MGIEKINAPAEFEHYLADRPITNLMLLIWLSRRDLQKAFDLHSKAGQEAFVNWYDVSVNREYGISPFNAVRKGMGVSESNTSALKETSKPLYLLLLAMESRLSRASRYLPENLRRKAKWAWVQVMTNAARISAGSPRRQETSADSIQSESLDRNPPQYRGEPGVNLIGYAHAELGMGEHVRMSAAAFSETNIPFGVLNFTVGVSSRQKASLDHGTVNDSKKYKANLFHINADQMLLAYCHLGKSFFHGSYNIGYWAWELANCPDEWAPVFSLVDEIWAPSQFIRNAFAEKTNLPVIHMPLCVTLPVVGKYSRSYFGLPDRSFLFLFLFDFYSYIDRKNPFAAILAFKRAFDMKQKDVGLVIKVMNADEKSMNWKMMLELIDGDPRIYVINKIMERAEVLSLIDTCDGFVSLHRSEGFGRGPAEAMYLGKPVVVTNYSGNTDFTRQDNSCLVNYTLIPVKDGQYIYESGQVWAEPDIEHAAWYMGKLVEDAEYCERIGKAGLAHIRNNYSQIAVGNMYQKRLDNLGLI